MNKTSYSTVVIGAGAGGLVLAVGSAAAGKDILLVERGNYGGDCTNFGCIPSKALIASAHAAYMIKEAKAYGIHTSFEKIDCSAALQRCRNIVEQFRSHETPEVLEKLGVHCLTGEASFLDPHHIEVICSDGNKIKIEGKRFVIATGSHPFIPPISGIEKISYLTNETIFQLEKIPERLAVIGGGPIGVELAQAFQRLGSYVHLIEFMPELLSREAPIAQEILKKQLENEGLQLYLNHESKLLEKSDNGTVIHLESRSDKKRTVIEIDHVLFAVGRRPNLEKLNLPAANIQNNHLGIITDSYGRSSQKHIYAVGDVSSSAQFTHIAENRARSVLTSLLIPGFFQSKIDEKQAIPRVTYTDPELASIGLSESEAHEKYGEHKITTYTIPFQQVDRAICEGREEGVLQVVTKKWSSKILGATIVAPRAGEMLNELSLAMHTKTPLRKLAKLIHPYPTYSLAIRKAADLWLKETILGTIRSLFSR
ncbi:MAG: mercuric reductase [Waddliaceae bacterium]|nr:mercuric reductase [Waddliaceae bacterium]